METEKKAFIRETEADIVSDLSERRGMEKLFCDFQTWNSFFVRAAAIGFTTVCELLLENADKVKPCSSSDHLTPDSHVDELNECFLLTHAALVAAFANGSHEAAKRILRYCDRSSGWLDTYMKPQEYNAVRAACSRGRKDMLDVSKFLTDTLNCIAE
jgi:hypothetical protein